MNAADVSNDALVALGKVVQELSEEWKSVDKADYDALQCVCVNDWSPGFETSVGEHASAILDALSEPKPFKRVLKVFWRATMARIKGAIKYPFFEGTLEDRRAKMQGVKDHLDGLRLVLSYRINRRKAVKADGLKFVEALECGRFACDEAVRVFEDSCAEKTLNTLISRSRGLSGFSGIKHEERIARFRELDESYTAAAQKMIVAMLSKKRDAIEHPPAMKDKDGNTVVHAMDPELQRQMAVLKRECEKKKRFMPPRKLLSETKNLAMKLKPCFLMSPLSVAQYLPVDGDLFDMVVFDEASQMTVWDAVGVIARGKQLIVVGDPKQLPPTNFFVKGDVKDEDREDDPATEDLESVLDECLANGLYSAYLNWHYRSRHESLIAFSNRNYYEDRLNTFPAAEFNDRLGVSFRYVDGALYDHLSHTNKNEAETLVDFLFERLENPAERKRSWGIVTFSVAQQRLVEDLIDKRSEGCDWAADFFDDSKPDAFFVKNLENVQGDERDVIIFSIAYAPDAQGRFAMSFGPINRPGGERRLNVAITRAREQVVIFASTHSSEIHAERTNSVGVKHLKALMEYAETGHLEGDAVKADGREATGIKKAVCDCLATNGYSFETDVGMSSYPVDVAVRDPKNQNRFVLGIECDGEKYAAQHTVRDRDVLRDSVLEGMGWKIFHAWSVDWTFDRKRAERRLLEVLPKVEHFYADN
jgi:very-short-patch-repair endonuclease